MSGGPPDAERMSSWISEDMVPRVGPGIIFGQQRPGADGSGLGEARLCVRDVKVQMDLLRISVWPFRRLTVGRVLHADHPLTRTVNHRAKPIAKYAITRAGNDRCRCSVRPHSAITSSTSPGGNTLVNKPTDTKSDNRRSDVGFFHPARGTPPNYTPVTLTERYWG